MTRPTTEQWRTAITRVEDSSIRYRGRPVETLIERGSVEEVVALVLFGEHCDDGAREAIRRALVAAADHGAAAPSIATTRICASTRIPIAAAVGAGLVAFAGPSHGGAAEVCAQFLVDVTAAAAGADDPDVAVEQAVLDALASGVRIAGYGHPVHRHDPRVEPMMNAPVERRDHRDVARRIEAVLLAQRSPRLTMNGDAAVAAMLLDAGFAPADVSALTAIGRVIGLAAHAREEWTREDPFRAPSTSAITYDGPGAD